LIRFCSASILVAFVVAAAGSAAAQWDPAPQQTPPAASPWNAAPQPAPAPAAASPWNAAPQQEPPCVAEFGKLRDDAQKKAGAIRAASARKADPKEACGLFTSFSASEAKLVKYAGDNAGSCGIPPAVVTSLKQQHLKTVDIQTKICRVAAAPPRQQGPSLSDTLGGSAVPDISNIRTGRGTYDTLTGTPLGKQ
jgi:hypothetical protein